MNPGRETRRSRRESAAEWRVRSWAKTDGLANLRIRLQFANSGNFTQIVRSERNRLAKDWFPGLITSSKVQVAPQSRRPRASLEANISVAAVMIAFKNSTSQMNSSTDLK